MTNWIIQHCSVAGCTVAIRVRVGDQSDNPICKWHVDGPNYMDPHDQTIQPYGMPDPDLPWPWQTEQERARRLRLPYWRDRFTKHATSYAKWMRNEKEKT